MNLPLAFGMPGPFETMGLLVIGLLIFGKRLPEVGRSIGQTVVQFKKGLNEMTEEVKNPGSTTSVEQAPPKQIADATSTFKFDPHTGEPINR